MQNVSLAFSEKFQNVSELFLKYIALEITYRLISFFRYISKQITKYVTFICICLSYPTIRPLRTGGVWCVDIYTVLRERDTGDRVIGQRARISMAQCNYWAARARSVPAERLQPG